MFELEVEHLQVKEQYLLRLPDRHVQEWCQPEQELIFVFIDQNFYLYLPCKYILIKSYIIANWDVLVKSEDLFVPKDR